MANSFYIIIHGTMHLPAGCNTSKGQRSISQETDKENVQLLILN
jgi:hypothetical protein